MAGAESGSPLNALGFFVLVIGASGRMPDAATNFFALGIVSAAT
jgi:hypothetical protein